MGSHARPEEDLLNYGRHIKEKHNKLRQEYRIMAEEAFDYHPRINRKSQIMVQDKEGYLSGDENVDGSEF